MVAVVKEGVALSIHSPSTQGRRAAAPPQPCFVHLLESVESVVALSSE